MPFISQNSIMIIFRTICVPLAGLDGERGHFDVGEKENGQICPTNYIIDDVYGRRN